MPAGVRAGAGRDVAAGRGHVSSRMGDRYVVRGSVVGGPGLRRRRPAGEPHRDDGLALAAADLAAVPADDLARDVEPEPEPGRLAALLVGRRARTARTGARAPRAASGGPSFRTRSTTASGSPASSTRAPACPGRRGPPRSRRGSRRPARAGRDPTRPRGRPRRVDRDLAIRVRRRAARPRRARRSRRGSPRGACDGDAVAEPRARVAEEVRDDPAHPPGRGAHPLDGARLPAREPALLLEERRRHVHGAERVAQVVADDAEDVVDRPAPALDVRLDARATASAAVRALARSSRVALEGERGAVGGDAEEEQRVLVERVRVREPRRSAPRVAPARAGRRGADARAGAGTARPGGGASADRAARRAPPRRGRPRSAPARRRRARPRRAISSRPPSPRAASDRARRPAGPRRERADEPPRRALLGLDREEPLGGRRERPPRPRAAGARSRWSASSRHPGIVGARPRVGEPPARPARRRDAPRRTRGGTARADRAARACCARAGTRARARAGMVPRPRARA